MTDKEYEFRTDPEIELSEMAREMRPGVTGYAVGADVTATAQALFQPVYSAYVSAALDLPPDRFTPEVVIALASNLAVAMVRNLRWKSDRSRVMGLGALHLTVEHAVRVEARQAGIELPSR